MFPFLTPQCLFDKSFSGHQELSYSLHPKPNPSPDLFPFSPLNFHNDSIHDLIDNPPLPTHNIPPPNPSPTKPMATTVHPPLSRKRALRKDRHSKIFTAQGPRDRRMRLSLEVARKFFDLQDMLGFDKASKTVLWLLTVSDSAIKDLIAASTPKDHAFSESSTVSDNKGKSSVRGNNKPNTRKARRLTVRASRKEAVHPMLVRESRAKARARARERTTEKKKIQGGWLDEMAKPNQLGPSFENDLKPLVTVFEEKSSLTSEQGKKPINDFPMEAGVGLNQIFDYNQNPITNHDVLSLLQEQLEMNLDDEERELLAHVQYPMRPYEVFNSNPILG